MNLSTRWQLIRFHFFSWLWPNLFIVAMGYLGGIWGYDWIFQQYRNFYQTNFVNKLMITVMILIITIPIFIECIKVIFNLCRLKIAYALQLIADLLFYFLAIILFISGGDLVIAGNTILWLINPFADRENIPISLVLAGEILSTFFKYWIR